MNLLLAAVFAATLSDATLLRLGRMDIEPKADGVITKAEIARASNQYGLISSETKIMALRYTMAYVGWTDTGVYCGVRSSVPTSPQKLTDDDTVTLTLQPQTTNYQLPTTNAHSFTKKVKDGRMLKGLMDYGVHAAETEFFIPFAELGVARPADGEAWGLQIAVRYSSEDETAYWHLPAKDGELGTLVFDAAAPVTGLVHFDVRESWRPSANYKPKFQYVNTTDREIKIDKSTSRFHCGIGFSKLDSNPEAALDVKHVAMPELGGFALPPHASDERIHIEWSVWPGSVNVLEIALSADGKPVFRRRLPWDVSRGKKWVDAIGLPQLRAGFWPTFGNRFRAQMFAGRVQGLVRGEIRVVGSDGVCRFERKVEGNPHCALIDVNLPDLPEQDYRAEMTVTDKAGRDYTDVYTFAVAKFPWQGNQLGKDRVVIPPFRPIRVEKGERGETINSQQPTASSQQPTTISFLQTGYRCKGVLWDEIYGAGENLLTAPVTLTLNGEEFKVTDAKIVEQSPDRVIREVSATLASSTNCQLPTTISLRVTQDYDYDGFCKVTARLKPAGPVKVESLKLTVPLKSELATLHEVSWTTYNRSKMGVDRSLPAHEGEVWNSQTDCPGGYQQNEYPAPLQAYVWWGGPEKGMAFLVDSVRDWSVERKANVQRIVRANGAAAFEHAFVNKPVEWDASEKTFVFYLQPTPVKPMTKGFEAFVEDMYDYESPTNGVRVHLGQTCHVWPLLAKMNTYPGGDRSLVRWLIASDHKDGAEFRRKVAEYAEKHADWFRESGLMSKDDFIASMCNDVRWMNVKAHMRYFDPLLLTCYWPEWEMYKAEWFPREWPEADVRNEYLGLLEPSRIDKLLWDINDSLDDGYKGVNFDVFGNGEHWNFVVDPSAYQLPTTNHQLPTSLRVQKTLTNLLAWRQLIKRTATLCHVRGLHVNGVPLVDLHTTELQAIPVTSWCSSAATTECGGNGGDFQDRFPEAFSLTRIMGRQSGTSMRCIVSTRMGDDARKERELLSLMGWMCAYGKFNIMDQGIIKRAWFEKAWNIVFDYGWGKPDVIPHWYYDGLPQPVKIVQSLKSNVQSSLDLGPWTLDSRSAVRLTVAERKGESALLMFGNLGDEAEVAFDVAGLGLGKVVLTDAETGVALPEPKIRIVRHGYRMVLVKKGEK